MLDVDPDLGQGITAGQRSLARERAIARVASFNGPGWDPTAIVSDEDARRPGEEWLGLLVLDGLLVRQVTLDGGRSSCEVLGAGDVLRPWDSDADVELALPHTINWRVVKHTTLALLDEPFARRIAPWPTITNQIIARLSRRAGYQALAHAISHAPAVDDRLPAILWLLAQRWGRMAPDGVRIKLPFTHDLLGVLVGARRPTVSLALKRLSEQNVLIRERPNTWLLPKPTVDRLTDIHGGGPPRDLVSRSGGGRIIIEH